MSDPDAACPVCNWSISQQSCCRYSSHSKLSYGVSTCGVWSLGPDVILKERPNSPPLDETLNVEHLRRHTTIPVPQVKKNWVDEGNRYFVLMERIKGQTLEEDGWCRPQMRKSA